MRRVVAALLLCLGAAAYTSHAAGTRAASPSTWFRVYPPEPGNPLAVTCPSVTVCYAAGTDGLVLWSPDSGQTWERRHASVAAGLAVRAISCASESTCVIAADATNGTFHTDVLSTTDGGATWQKRYSTDWGGTRGLACPTAGECYAILHDRFFAARGDGSGWHERAFSMPATNMFPAGLSCPASATCYVAASESMGNRYGAVLATRDGGKTWRTRVIGPKKMHNGTFMGISCPGAATCYGLVMGKTSGVLVTRNAWKTTAYHPIKIPQPAGQMPGSAYVTQPACPTQLTCYARSTTGAVVSTVNGGVSWQVHALQHVEPQLAYLYYVPNGLTGLACPAARTCIALNTTGDLLRTADGATSWSTTFIGTARPLTGTACTDSASCFAVGPDGTLLGAEAGGPWTRRPSPLGASNSALIAIACHGSSLCVSGGTDGTVAVTRDAGATWSHEKLTEPGSDEVIFQAAACATDTTCYVAGYAYHSGAPGPIHAVLERTDDGGATWTELGLPAETWRVNAIACATARVCLVGTGDASDDDSYPSGSLLLTRDGGATWKKIDTEAYFGITCPGGNTCEAVGQSSSRAPLAERVTLAGKIVATWEGRDQQYFRESLNGVACTGDTECYAVGDGGLVAHTSDGKQWSASALGIQVLSAVTCVRGSVCYSAGSESTVLSDAAVAGSAAVPTATPLGRLKPLPTATPVPAMPLPTTIAKSRGCPPACTPGMVLYRANWSHGFDGWHGPDGGTQRWRVRKGSLVTPLVTYQLSAIPLLPPFQPGAHGVKNYAVQFQVRDTDRSADFHVHLRQDGMRYDDFAVSSCCTSMANVSVIYRDDARQVDAIVGDADFPLLDTRWHTFRLEVRGAQARVIVDGRELIRGLDRHVLNGGQVEIVPQYAPVMFRRFMIVSL